MVDRVACGVDAVDSAGSFCSFGGSRSSLCVCMQHTANPPSPRFREFSMTFRSCTNLGAGWHRDLVLTLVPAGGRGAPVGARRAIAFGAGPARPAAEGVPQPELAQELRDGRVAAAHDVLNRLENAVDRVRDGVRQRRVGRPDGEAALALYP